MHQAIKDMLERYTCKTSEDYKNALKEIMQEIALLGLSRQKFFDKAAFYGGTALRIAHGLGRFSEDMDFTLLQNKNSFNITQYLKGIEDEFSSFGLGLSSEKRHKSVETTIDSAFLKANTLEYLLQIEGLNNPASGTNKNELLKIKLEIDINPPTPAGNSETLFLTQPIPFSYKMLTLPSLFGGKLHALLCRSYPSGRVKGRDYYDFIWYTNKGIKPDMAYLKGKLCDSGHWSSSKELTTKDLQDLLKQKFEKTNWEQAKKDVIPFLKNSEEVQVWSTTFFNSLIPKVT
ncbi:MAG: nucleotidyl transferase AbiEii/AbiGii toxin family protein [Bacteriovoracaceae bacterium]|jgi:hypothetical protein|nr:nucleotidyl transferase AbiEii/AbiGii toxin family protein [Bacteriovoracaceae bacterium]